MLSKGTQTTPLSSTQKTFKIVYGSIKTRYEEVSKDSENGRGQGFHVVIFR